MLKSAMRLPAVSLVVASICLSGGTAFAVPKTAPRPTWDERRLALPIVGSGTAFVPHQPTPHVVILVSGAGGWNASMTALARRIAAAPAVVIGLPLPSLTRNAAKDGGCWYVASDFELISHAAQKALALPQYHPPVLVGYDAGASTVYAALAATPATTFAGAMSLGFCPTLHVAREICAGDTWSPDYDEKTRVNALPPTRALPKDWWVVQGVGDRICPIDTVRRFVGGLPKTHLVEVDRMARAIGRPDVWGAAFDRALQELWTEKEVKPAASQPRSASMRELEDALQKLQLPLEFRWPSSPVSALLVFFSGDGGWASLDEDTAEQLVTTGVGVVGVSSLRYFWQAKPPTQVAADLRRLVAVLAASGRPIFAGGFSFGAEVVPVSLREWTPAERKQLSGLALISPSVSASFEIDPLDWVRRPVDNPATRVAPAVRDVGLPTLCLSGADEDDTPCPALVGAPGVRVVRLPGSHHFNNDYTAVADTVRQFLRATMEKRP